MPPDTVASLPDSVPLFAFEVPSCDNLRFIPLGVRHHLDRAGLRISLEFWQGLPWSVRVELAACPVDGTAGQRHFAEVLIAAAQAAGLSDPERIAPLSPMPGEDVSRVPETVVTQCRLAQLEAPSAAAWSELSPLQRYALAKLSRKPTANHDFVPALREFGLA